MHMGAACGIRVASQKRRLTTWSCLTATDASKLDATAVAKLGIGNEPVPQLWQARTMNAVRLAKKITEKNLRYREKNL